MAENSSDSDRNRGANDRTRRTVLQVGAFGAAGLAGCFHGDGDVTPTPGGSPATETAAVGSPTADEQRTVANTTPAPGPTPDQACAPRAYDEEGQRVIPLNRCQPEHPRHRGPVTAMGWSPTSQPVDEFESAGFAYLSNFIEFGAGEAGEPTHQFKDEELDKLTDWLGKWPEGRRGLTLFNMRKYYTNSYANRDQRDAPIIGRLAEDVGGERRETIEVEPLPTDLIGDNQSVSIYTSSEVPLQPEYQSVFPAASEGEGATEIRVQKDMEIVGKKGDPITLVGAQSFWPYHTVRTTKMWMDKVMTAIEDADLTLDYLILDNEAGFIPDREWSRTSNQADPRWDDPEHGYGGKSLAELSGSYSYSALGQIAQDWGMFAGLTTPVREYFPGIKSSDWDDIGLTADSQGFYKGIQTPSQPGTHSAWQFYAWGSGPNGQLRSTVGLYRVLRKFTNGAIQPWIAWKTFSDGTFNAGVRNNYMYEEMVRHIALHEPDPILYFRWDGADDWTDEQDPILDRVLTEVNRELGGGYSLATEFTPTRGENWQDGPGGGPGWGYNTTADKLDDGDVTTGVKLADGSALWRLSCRRFGVKEDNSLPEDSGPVEITVTQAGSEVGTATIPGGEGGVWWRHDDPEVDLTFEYAYPELKR